MRCSGVRKKPRLSSATHELEKVVDDPDALFGALETAEALSIVLADAVGPKRTR